MKLYFKIVFGILIIAVAACNKFEFKNPWDDNSVLSPSEWSPQIASIKEISITAKEINIGIGDYQVEGFYVDRKVGDQEWLVKYKTLESSVRRFIDDDILPDTNLSYYYRISSFAGNQVSQAVEQHSKAKFDAPEQLTVQKLNEKEYSVKWSHESEGEEGFKLWKQKKGEAWYLLTILPPNTEMYIDTNIFVNKEEWEIKYKVQAFYREYYTAEKITTLQVGLDSPESLKVSALNNISLQINWKSKSTNEDGFIVERYDESEGWIELVRTIDTSFVDNSFKINSNILYRLSAYIGNYQSAYKEITYQSIIESPTEFVINKNNDFSIDIEWTYQSEGQQGFKIDRKLNEEAWEMVYAEVAAGERKFTDNNVDIQNNDYTYRIYAYIDAEQSDYLERFLHIPEIGDFYAGGYVYYLDDNVGGMVIARIDTDPNLGWGCYGTYCEAIGEDVGDGLQNTLNIINTCDEDWSGAWKSYNWEHEGYDDWFMPSEGSLQLVYENLYLQGIGDFISSNGYLFYWSSTEYHEYSAKYISFLSGKWFVTGKVSGGALRSVRKF